MADATIFWSDGGVNIKMRIKI